MASLPGDSWSFNSPSFSVFLLSFLSILPSPFYPLLWLSLPLLLLLLWFYSGFLFLFTLSWCVSLFLISFHLSLLSYFGFSPLSPLLSKSLSASVSFPSQPNFKACPGLPSPLFPSPSLPCYIPFS